LKILKLLSDTSLTPLRLLLELADSCIKDADKLSDEEYKAWIDTASNMYEKCSKRNWAK
jgi:hypothetical protein